MNFNIDNFEERLKVKNTFDGNLVFGAKKFHSETARSGKGKPSSGGLIREHAKVVEDTGLERYQRIKDYWESVEECPVCGTNKNEFFLTRYGLDIYKCLKCSHRYLNPRIKYHKLIDIYADDKTASDIYTKKIQKNIDRIKYSYGLEILSQLSPDSKDKIMDLGCGAGVLLETAHQQGWKQCIGVDVNERYKDIYNASTSGVQFINSSFEDMDIDKLGTGYDAITMWNVFEHLYDIQGMLRSIKNMLKDKGLFMLMIPNVESLATRLMREKSPTFNWKHVSHFSPGSLRYLMNENGFEECFFETVISEIDNVKSYMSGEYPYHGYGDPEHLFDFISPEYIHKNLLGSRILAVFRKK